MDVKVFISWSGEPSQSLARVLREWLPTVVQHAEPWMSDEEIKSGTRWNDEVAKALDGTDFGIVCVTASNQHQPWLMFEAGALAKRLDVGRLVPLCIDLAPAEVTGPLEAFQARCLDESGMRRLVQDMMILRDKPPTEVQIGQLFEAMWPSLESPVSEAKQQSPSPQNPQRTTKDMLEELVDRVRRIERVYSRSVFDVASIGLGATVTDTSWESLTPTELEVVRHISAGLTNREIGERMFISPGTVKVHLSHILAKLGIPTRAHLAARHKLSDHK